jgi:hypothetical protein
VLVEEIKDGEIVLANAFEPLNKATIARLLSAGIAKVTVVDVSADDTVIKSLRKDPARNEEEALKDIYRKLRPGDPPTVANAKSMLRERGSAIRCVFWFFFGWLALGQHSTEHADSDLDEASAKMLDEFDGVRSGLCACLSLLYILCLLQLYDSTYMYVQYCGMRPIIEKLWAMNKILNDLIC